MLTICVVYVFVNVLSITVSLDFKEIIAQRRLVFVETSQERITNLYECIDQILNEELERGELYNQFITELHSLKGSAGTFGFEFVSVITHNLEDFIASHRRLRKKHWKIVQKYLDQISDIFENGEDVLEEDQNDILRDLRKLSYDTTDDITDKTVLLITSLQSTRLMIESIIHKLGHNVIFANEPIESLKVATKTKPDAIICSQVFPFISGAEFSNIVTAIPRLQNTPFALIKSDNETLKNPENAASNIKIIQNDHNIQTKVQNFLVTVFDK